MNNFVVSGDYVGCKVKHTNNHLYIHFKNSLAVFISMNTITNYELLYSDNKNRYCLKIYFKNKKISVLEINKSLYNLLIKSLYR